MLPSEPGGAAVAPSSRCQIEELGFAEPSYSLVLFKGRFSAELSRLDQLPSGVWLGPMATAIAKRPDLIRPGFEAQSVDRPFASLNAAFFADGFVLDVAPGVALKRPVEIVHLSDDDTGGSLHTRSLVVAGRGSRATLVASHTGLGEDWRTDGAGPPP